MIYRVMLSYSWRNNEELTAIANCLRKIEGIQVLYDKEKIKLGDPVHSVISQLIDDSDCIIALLTSEGMASHEVHDEVVRAHERNKTIIPIISDDVSPDKLPWFLRDINFVRYRPADFDSVLAAISESVRSALHERMLWDIQHGSDDFQSKLEKRGKLRKLIKRERRELPKWIQKAKRQGPEMTSDIAYDKARLLDKKTHENSQDYTLELVDVAVIKKSFSILDIKLRNTGDKPAFIKRLDVEMIERAATGWISKMEPAKISYKYHLMMDFPQGVTKSFHLAHVVDPSGTDRFQIVLGSTEADHVYCKLRLIFRYNKWDYIESTVIHTVISPSRKIGTLEKLESLYEMKDPFTIEPASRDDDWGY
jgi:hypothetical protein